MSNSIVYYLSMSREKLVGELVDVFRLYGYDGASLACIAQATGLGKTNLYHYFPGGKAEMAAAALDRVNIWLETRILENLRGSERPIAKIQIMCDEVNKFFNEGHNSCLWAVLALGRSSEDLFQQQIKSALLQWIAALAKVLEDGSYHPDTARHRAEDTILRIQGALVLARGLGDTAPFQRLMQSLPSDLLPE
jgi:TetR/AcrR family transcriptional regulator, lmrAB and yxaGH operons repressor